MGFENNGNEFRFLLNSSKHRFQKFQLVLDQYCF